MAAVVVLSRVTVLGMVALSVVAGVQTAAYTQAPLAAGVYLAVAGYGALLVVLVVRASVVPAWAMIADVAIASAGVIVLPLAAHPAYFMAVANSDLEPVIVSVPVAIALITASVRSTAAACAALAAAYVIGQAPMAHSLANATSIAAPICWQVATAACCAVFIRRLRAVADAVDAANRRVLRAREKVAAERAEAEQRRRHFREQIRRHRALHDGPLRILTAIAGPGPLGHPDAKVRRQCATAANVLRGTTPDDPEGTLTDLSLALIEAGGDSAANGLRVEYHFANLPDDLPREVVQAFALAGAEALSNVAAHAGTTSARLTALAVSTPSAPGTPSTPSAPSTPGTPSALGAPGAPGRPTVTVAIVDQGKGFDPRVTEHGYGIRHCVLDRMREVGGDATIDSDPGQGTRVDLRWPR